MNRIVSATGATLLALSLSAAAASAAAAETRVFDVSGEHMFVVPAGVDSLLVEARGGHGSDGGPNIDDGVGGRPERVTAQLPVRPGDVLYAIVAGPEAVPATAVRPAPPTGATPALPGTTAASSPVARQAAGAAARPRPAPGTADPAGRAGSPRPAPERMGSSGGAATAAAPTTADRAAVAVEPPTAPLVEATPAPAAWRIRPRR
jgi:hypothetical protein